MRLNDSSQDVVDRRVEVKEAVDAQADPHVVGIRARLARERLPVPGGLLDIRKTRQRPESSVGVEGGGGGSPRAPVDGIRVLDTELRERVVHKGGPGWAHSPYSRRKARL